jgi:hypothetical protein
MMLFILAVLRNYLSALFICILFPLMLPDQDHITFMLMYTAIPAFKL